MVRSRIAYGATDRKPTEAAAELVRAAGERKLPRELPTDRDFRFGSEPESLGRAYESGWLACRMIADRWGEARLGAFYRAVGAHGKRAGAVEGALEKVLGTTTDEFTSQWHDYLLAQLG